LIRGDVWNRSRPGGLDPDLDIAGGADPEYKKRDPEYTKRDPACTVRKGIRNIRKGIMKTALKKFQARWTP